MTSSINPKKMIIVNILDILKKYSGEDHRLSQKDIVDLLYNQYGMVVNRKSVKRNLMNLVEAGYNLSYTETVRVNKNGEEEIIYTDWYLERDFTDAELRLLVDSILFSKHIPTKQCKSLIEKIEGLSNMYFKSKVKHICNLPAETPRNPELFYTIEVLDEAIEKGLQVSFNYSDYGVDKKPHMRRRANGEIREYIINPYQMAATNGRYYLICNYDSYDEIGHYRIDQIHNIKLLNTPVKSMRKVKGMEHGIDLPKHMAEHIYMYSGPSERITFLAPPSMAGEILNWFGSDTRFFDITDKEMTVQVVANLESMKYWILQYSAYVRVTSPKSLVDNVKKILEDALKKY